MLFRVCHGYEPHVKLSQDPTAGHNAENSTTTGSTHQRRLMLIKDGTGATVEQHKGGVSQESVDSFEVFKNDETFDKLNTAEDDTSEGHGQGLYNYNIDDYGMYVDLQYYLIGRALVALWLYNFCVLLDYLIFLRVF